MGSCQKRMLPFPYIFLHGKVRIIFFQYNFMRHYFYKAAGLGVFANELPGRIGLQILFMYHRGEQVSHDRVEVPFLQLRPEQARILAHGDQLGCAENLEAGLHFAVIKGLLVNKGRHAGITLYIGDLCARAAQYVEREPLVEKLQGRCARLVLIGGCKHQGRAVQHAAAVLARMGVRPARGCRKHGEYLFLYKSSYRFSAVFIFRLMKSCC